MVALVRKRRGRGWGLGRRAVLTAPPGRLSGSGSCGPARRPGPRRLGGGSAQAPGHARVLEPGQQQAGRSLGAWRAGAAVVGRVCGSGVTAGRRRAGPGSGCARAHADREWGLAAGGRLGSARPPGSGGSSRPTPRTTEPPQRSSASALTTGPARSREADRSGFRSGWSPPSLGSGTGSLLGMTEVCHGRSGQS
jgi:hypothetical protein